MMMKSACDDRDYTGVAGWEAAEWLSKTLKEKGLTAADIELRTEAMGSPIDSTSLSRWYSNKRPDIVLLDTIDRICLVLGEQMALASFKVICRPSKSAARRMALDEIGEYTTEDLKAHAALVAEWADRLLADSREHLAIGEPSSVTVAV